MTVSALILTIVGLAGIAMVKENARAKLNEFVAQETSSIAALSRRNDDLNDRLRDAEKQTASLRMAQEEEAKKAMRSLLETKFLDVGVDSGITCGEWQQRTQDLANKLSDLIPFVSEENVYDMRIARSQLRSFAASLGKMPHDARIIINTEAVRLANSILLIAREVKSVLERWK